MSSRALLAFIAFLTAPAAASAQATDPNTLSLSDAEKAELSSHYTEESVDAARSGLGGSPGSDRAVHGEIGALVGSHGTRAAYGVATVPLGESSRATVMVESSHTDFPR